MYVCGHPGVDAGAGDGQGDASVDVNGVHGKPGAVPQVFRILKKGRAITEVLQKIVAGAHGDHRHGGVVIADDAVGYLVGGPVAAAGVEPQLLPAFAQLAGQFGGVSLILGEDALHLQSVLLPQSLRHVIDTLPAVVLAGVGIDDKNMLHSCIPSAECVLSLLHLSIVPVPRRMS